LQKTRSLTDAHQSFLIHIDAKLTLGWVLLLLGKPQKALRLAKKIRRMRLSSEIGRCRLLAGHAKLILGDPDAALREAKSSMQHFSASAPYYRVKARLLQAEIMLNKPELGNPVPLISDALRLSQKEYYIPLLAKAYLLKSQWLLDHGDSQSARSFCLRALQLATAVDRPRLEAEIYLTLGDQLSRAGEPRRAAGALDIAYELVQERYLQLPADLRKAFFRTYLEPIETKQASLQNNYPHHILRFLTRMRLYSQKLTRVEGERQLAEATLSAVTGGVPGASAILFLRAGEDGSFYVAGTIGKCVSSGRGYLPVNKQIRKTRIILDPNRGITSIPIQLRTRARTLGLLYIELPGSSLVEGHIDYLHCIADTASLQLASHRTPGRTFAISGKGLPLLDGRRIVGAHPIMQQLFTQIRQIAQSDITVLIQGESGTGKELVARAIHDYSDRASGPFTALNCSTLPEQLVESELFGHAKGSFTGATTSKKGLFAAASGGTLFLDEIGTMPIGLQPRLLRALEEKVIRKVGETHETSVDIRVLAATNVDLANLVKTDRFRSDLYHRLSVFQLSVPPLRSRISDVEYLIEQFLSDLNRRTGSDIEIERAALALLRKQDFPGNVRELRNLIEGLYCTSSDGVIREEEVVSRLSARCRSAIQSAESHPRQIFDEMGAGIADFWDAVKAPFLNRDLTRSEVREIVSLGLLVCGGSYRRVAEYFGLPKKDYKRFLNFLNKHNCKVDFRPFRRVGD
jgi:DNA-binding NtrC family response regulator/tetratricopeptide (TPR) repeat protein